MYLSEIWIYPVKSLGGLRLADALVLEKGLQYDRRWMVVDENGVFLTQRVNGKMALIEVTLQDDGLILSQKNYPKNYIRVPFEVSDPVELQVKVWDDVVLAQTVGTDIDEWLSKQLEKKVRLVKMSSATNRKMDAAYAEEGSEVSFADDFPYLLISQESLNDLNSKLSEPVAMKRFRPNFVIAGCGAFEEDTWNSISINNLRFNVSKPCERCVLINVDPATGNRGSDPLKTLASYRRKDRKILFGQNLVGLDTGMIREGDAVICL